MILKRMKRRHLSADAIRFCAEARRLRPDIVFGADLIAGFPTETDAMFAQSLDIVDACELTWLHVFPFSLRTGTPAARMPQVPRAVAKERAARLRSKGEEMVARHLDRECGRTVDVVVEANRIGRTPHFAEVELGGSLAAIGKLAAVRVTGHDGRRLQGEVRP